MPEYNNEFGSRFKEIRRESGVTLREFCREHGFDHGNLSRIERGLAKPPTKERLKTYLSALGVQEESDLWYELHDLAHACAGELPPDIMSDERMIKKLPAVFRTVARKKPTEEEVRELIDFIRSEGREE